MKINFILLAVLTHLVTHAVTAQQCSSEWTSRGNSCYKWFSQPHYWFDAEQICRSHQGHLVSIQSQHENALVARLAQCKSAWIGRFGTDLNKLNHTKSYTWTDGSDDVSFERHNFTQLNSVHKPLIRSDGEWWINSLYHERHPFVCEQSFKQHNKTLRCPNGWSLYQNHCYLMSDFESNFNEANFYCQRKSSQLVSVRNQPELNSINRLIFDIDSCGPNPIDTVWLGLIKLNPCFPDSGGRELCYQWTDFSGKHVGFPIWQLGHPNNSDWTVNCVTLRGDRLYSEACYNRHRFVCKSAARNDTDGGGSGSVDGVVAAFDFRKGLENLVDPNTYMVRDDFGVARSAEKGACFSNDTYYRIGDAMHYNNTFLSNLEWTIFFSTWMEDRGSVFFLSIREASGSAELLPPFFIQSYNLHLPYDHFYAVEYQYNGRNSTTFVNANDFERVTSACRISGCSYAIASSNYQYSYNVNGSSSMQGHYRRYVDSRALWPELNNIFLGQTPYQPGWKQDKICIRCFGIATKKLNKQDINKLLNIYC